VTDRASSYLLSPARNGTVVSKAKRWDPVKKNPQFKNVIHLEIEQEKKKVEEQYRVQEQFLKPYPISSAKKESIQLQPQEALERIQELEGQLKELQSALELERARNMASENELCQTNSQLITSQEKLHEEVKNLKKQLENFVKSERSLEERLKAALLNEQEHRRLIEKLETQKDCTSVANTISKEEQSSLEIQQLVGKIKELESKLLEENQLRQNAEKQLEKMECKVTDMEHQQKMKQKLIKTKENYCLLLHNNSLLKTSALHGNETFSFQDQHHDVVVDEIQLNLRASSSMLDNLQTTVDAIFTNRSGTGLDAEEDSSDFLKLYCVPLKSIFKEEIGRRHFAMLLSSHVKKLGGITLSSEAFDSLLYLINETLRNFEAEKSMRTQKLDFIIAKIFLRCTTNILRKIGEKSEPMKNLIKHYQIWKEINFWLDYFADELYS